jgi:hypothetical protein
MSNRAKLGLAMLVVIIIFSALSLLYWNFIRDTIVTPLYYLLWFGDLMLKSIPQEVFLGLLIVISAIIALNTLGKVRTQRRVPESERSRSVGGARYLEWKRLADFKISNRFVRNQFTWETRKLILSLIAYQENIDTATAEEIIKNDRLDVPNVVKTLIERREIPVSDKITSKNLFFRLRQMLPGVDDAPQTDPLSDEIIAYIEQRLEISHVGNQPEG